MIDSYELTPSHEPNGVVNTLETLQASTVLDTVNGREDFFNSLNFESFISLIDTISESIVFDVSEALGTDDGVHAISFRGSDAVSPLKEEQWWGYIAPDHEHKEDLLRTAFTVAQEQENTESAATLLALSIAAIHPYGDSNGRTGRVLYGLLTRGYNGSEADQGYYRRLSSHEGRDILNFSPEKANLPALFVGNELDKRNIQPLDLFYRAQRPSNWKWRIDAALGSSTVRRALSESYFGLIPLFEGMSDSTSPDLYGKYMQLEGQERLALQADKVFPSPWQIDTSRILRQQGKRKLAYVNAVIDCFRRDQTNPLADSRVLTDIYRSADV